MASSWSPSTHLPRTVEQFGVTDVTRLSRPTLPPSRAAEDFLVGGDPLNAVPRQQRNHRLTDRTLAWPHAARPLAEDGLVTFDSAADVNFGVLRIAVPVGGEIHVGHRLARQPLVEEQGEDRVVERRRGQLDLATLGEFPVERDDLGEQARCLSSSQCFSSSVVPPALAPELGEFRVVLEEQRVHPGQVGPDLKVADVALAEPVQGLLGRFDTHRA